MYISVPIITFLIATINHHQFPYYHCMFTHLKSKLIAPTPPGGPGRPGHRPAFGGRAADGLRGLGLGQTAGGDGNVRGPGDPR